MVAASRVLRERQALVPQRFDVAGAALLAVGLATLTAALSVGTERGWASTRFIGAVAIAAVALAVTRPIERRQRSPIIDLGLLRNRVFVLANASFTLCMLALFAVGFLLPFYFEELRGFDTFKSGLLLTPLSLTLGVIPPLSGTFADRAGSRWLAPAGLAVHSRPDAAPQSLLTLPPRGRDSRSGNRPRPRPGRSPASSARSSANRRRASRPSRRRLRTRPGR